MELTEDEFTQKYSKNCGHCNRNTLLLYEYEYTCLSCGYNVIKRKHALSKIQRKKINFINRSKHAEQKIFSICVDVYKIYEVNDYDKIYDVLPTLKNKKIKNSNTLIEKYRDMLKNPDFEQDYWSRTTEGLYNIGHDGIRLMKWFIYHDRSCYDNKNTLI